MLEASSLKVAYGPIVALHDVSISVKEGEFITVIGSNGAGKSTLLKTLCGLLSPIAGSITFSGESIAGLPSSTVIQRGIALIPEGRHVFPEMTVGENLDLGAYYRRNSKAVREDLEKVLLLFPILRERLRMHAGRLSGGQQQMLAIGRGLMSRPRLLLLDEPSLGLAPAIVQQLGRVLSDLNRTGTTIVMVEQNARMALRLANRAYVMATGRIVRSGTGRELLDDPAVQASYLGGEAAA